MSKGWPFSTRMFVSRHVAQGGARESLMDLLKTPPTRAKNRPGSLFRENSKGLPVVPPSSGIASVLGRDRARDLRDARGFRGRHPRLEPHNIRVRQDNSSLQVMRIDLDGAVSLAVQLLSELRAWPDARLDE
jgi:hypothetical protein